MIDIDYTKDDYHKLRHPELINSSELQIAWASCAKKFYFDGFQDGIDIFEFGGGLGYNLMALSDKNNCHLLELSEIGRLNAAKYNIATYSNNSDVCNKKFDVILCRHVLEHVDSPLETLIFLKSLLKSGGCLILVIPLENSEMKPIDHEIDFHLYSWNPRTIMNLVAKSGFSNSSYRFQFFNGRRILLPLYRLAGARVYSQAVSLFGRLTRSKELVVECR